MPGATRSAPTACLGLGGVKPYVVSTELERTGVIATLEYQPTDNFNTALDVYYTKFKDDQLLRGIELPLLWGGATLRPGYTVATAWPVGHVRQRQRCGA